MSQLFIVQGVRIWHYVIEFVLSVVGVATRMFGQVATKLAVLWFVLSADTMRAGGVNTT